MENGNKLPNLVSSLLEVNGRLLTVGEYSVANSSHVLVLAAVSRRGVHCDVDQTQN